MKLHKVYSKFSILIASISFLSRSFGAGIQKLSLVYLRKIFEKIANGLNFLSVALEQLASDFSLVKINVD